MAAGTSDFPTTIDDNGVKDSSTELTSTLYNNAFEQIEALETKVGVDSSAVTTSHDYKLSGVTGTDKAVSITGAETLTGKTLSTDCVIDTNVTVTEVLKKVYPVGSVYINYLSTNPATLLGFGTWSAIAEAEALVGYKSADTPFGTVGSIGAAGAKTVAADLAVHTHTQTAHAHTLPQGREGNLTNPGAYISDGWSNGGGTATAPSVNTGLNTPAIQNAGAGGGHNNIQPSFVVYIWRRTA